MLWSECCIVIFMQPSGMHSEQETECAEGVDTMDQERRKLRLERKAFRKDHEMVGGWSAPSQLPTACIQACRMHACL